LLVCFFFVFGVAGKTKKNMESNDLEITRPPMKRPWFIQEPDWGLIDQKLEQAVSGPKAESKPVQEQEKEETESKVQESQQVQTESKVQEQEKEQTGSKQVQSESKVQETERQIEDQIEDQDDEPVTAPKRKRLKRPILED
jgi:hypothetical protein